MRRVKPGSVNTTTLQIQPLPSQSQLERCLDQWVCDLHLYHQSSHGPHLLVFNTCICRVQCDPITLSIFWNIQDVWPHCICIVNKNMSRYVKYLYKHLYFLVLVCINRHTAIWCGQDKTTGRTGWTADNEMWVFRWNYVNMFSIIGIQSFGLTCIIKSEYDINVQYYLCSVHTSLIQHILCDEKDSCWKWSIRTICR